MTYTGTLIDGLIATVEQVEATQPHDHRCVGCGAKLVCSDDCKQPADAQLVCRDCSDEVRR